jgi:hypothetical protein
MDVPVAVRTLLLGALSALQVALLQKSFPARRRDYAVLQIARLQEAADGLVPEYDGYGLRELSRLRGTAGPSAYVVRVDTTEGRMEFWRQVLAHEARVMEAHVESTRAFPKTSGRLIEANVRAMRSFALAVD